jgi:WD40 repeat protein
MEISTHASFIACNRSPGAGDYDPHGNVFAFGAQNWIAFMHPGDDDGIVETCFGHTDTVNVVRFVGQDVLLSGSVDTTIRVWRRMGDKVCSW